MSGNQSAFRNAGLTKNAQGLWVDNGFPANRSVERFKEATARNGFPLPNIWGMAKQVQYFLDNTKEQIPIAAIPAGKTHPWDWVEGGMVTQWKNTKGLLVLTQDFLIYSACQSLRFGSEANRFEPHALSENVKIVFAEQNRKRAFIQNIEGPSLVTSEDKPSFYSNESGLAGDIKALAKFAKNIGLYEYVPTPPPAPPPPGPRL
jgi:hypothetical protein